MGELLQDWGVPEKALPYYKTVEQLQLQDGQSPSPLLLEHMAEAYLSLQQKDKALELYHQLLTKMRKREDAQQTKRVLEKIVQIYSSSADLQNSLNYNLELLEITKQLYDSISTAATLNVIGNHYKDMNNSNKALESYQAALKLNRQIGKKESENAIITNLINIGSIYQSRGDSRSAIRSFNEALDIKKKSGSPVEIAVMYNYLATLYLSLGNLSEAEEYTQQSIQLLKGTDNRRLLARNYKRLSEIHEKQERYDKALASYQIYSVLNDSLLYQEQVQQENERLKQYAVETTEKEAKLSQIDHEMQALVLRSEKESAERERQQIELLLKEKELQNVSLQKEQLEQARAVQQLQLQQGKIEKEKQEQEILLLEQRRDLQNAEIEQKELQALERQKEIAIKNSELALQESRLERVGIQQQLLIYTVLSFSVIILIVVYSYWTKRKDNKKLQAQYKEINQQKEQIESINKSLVELNEEKNDLISIVAHDLKSPLNQISGMLEIIKLSSQNQPSEHSEYTVKIEQSTNRLKKMVTKILDVSAIESKTLNITLEKVNLAALLEDIVSRFSEMAAKKEITLVKEIDHHVPSIISDSNYISEVLENLLSNAVKYSPLGKQVTIKLHQHADYIRMEFIDQGQGISEKDMKNLFGKYHKLSARPTAGEDSTGLGLSIVRKYVLALNGRVWCESEEGKGANFIVELPLAS
jgi:signal transduction histidine kinase